MGLKDKIEKMFGIYIEQDPEIEQESEIEQNDEPKLLGQCNFVLLSNGQIHVICSWDDSNTKEIGEIYGQLLYYINTGKLKPQIQQVLTNQCQQDFSCKPFVQAVFESWNKQSEDKPAIHPRTVFSLPNEE